ncbi:MAG: DUF4835 family protein [Bacteroidales bacterium]|nr:DUF4835 family protein [Bacteroidales bacterium]
MKKILIAIVLLYTAAQGRAQEFLCDVQVTAPTVEGTDRRVFEALQEAIYDFMNNRKWTNLNLKLEERIECTMVLTVRERISSDEFKGTLNIVLRRPVFKSSYNSVLLNYIDDNIQFRYIENQPLDYNDNSFTSNLTSILAYYCYIFLGLDFDSFSPMGGEPFYQAAEAIVNTAQNANESGWKAFDGTKNRYWLVENLRNTAFKPMRQFLYEYHRTGMDLMSEKPDEGRAAIGASLSHLEKMYRDRPGLFLLQLVLEAKRDEIIQVYSQGSPQEKTKITNLMREIDPANSSTYEKIIRR